MDILHAIMATLIFVWLLYQQWLITKVLDLMHEMAEKLPSSRKSDVKEADRSNKRKTVISCKAVKNK